MTHDPARDPSELDDIFLHEERGETTAWRAGQLIARWRPGGRERFYADLHVWMRRHRYQGPIWKTMPDGRIVRDEATREAAAQAFADQPLPPLPEE